jgi:hypothetical protein
MSWKSWRRDLLFAMIGAFVTVILVTGFLIHVERREREEARKLQQDIERKLHEIESLLKR